MLKDKVAVITGAARGIGLGIAKLFVTNGAKVFIVDVDEEAVNKAICSLKSFGTVDGKKADVTDGESMSKVFDDVKGQFGSVDILINNAGVTRDALLLRMKETDWDMVMDVNLKGAFVSTQKVSKIMMKQKSGVIINIASVIGLMGNIGQSNYAASKGGLIAFSKSVAKELCSRGIRCNAVAPGFIQTEMTESLPEEVVSGYKSAIPLGYLGSVDDVAELCLFLSSDRARYITGQTINVDGGIVMR